MTVRPLGRPRDGPARAVQAAVAIRDEVRPLGIEIRAGLHTGECAVSDGKLAGIAVAGSGLRFEDRGERQLKGVPGAWHLYRAVSTDPEPRAS